MYVTNIFLEQLFGEIFNISLYLTVNDNFETVHVYDVIVT